MNKSQFLRDDAGREVVIFTTPSGVRAVVATCISDEALKKLARKLQRKIRARERTQALAVLTGKRG